MEKFWNILDERLELVKEALLLRDKLLQGVKAKSSPIHWMYGSVARLNAEDTIDWYLHSGYSTISLGYIGIYEMCLAMLGKSNTTQEGHDFALAVMKHLEEKAAYWKEHVDGLQGCSVYGTPSESLCYKLNKTLKKRFGEIKGITDKDWITNSYHVVVTEDIDAFSKLKFESEFQEHSKGGMISYIEINDLNKNLEVLDEIVQYMYENIQYAEINSSGCDICLACNYQGEMKIDDNGHWYCPHCGNKDMKQMYILKRICGYLSNSSQAGGFNFGKTMEIKNRVKHI